MAVVLPKLYVIADGETLNKHGFDLRTFATELRDAGVRLLQYRDKVSGPKEILRAAADISDVFVDVEATLILNDRADLAALAGWGVHVGQDDLPVEAARRVLAVRDRVGHGRASRAMAHPVIGISTHGEEQVAAADLSSADYIAVGPVFSTSTKADAETVVGLDGVRRARALTTKPLVAIGGITRKNARLVMEAGADSVAVIGAMFANGERPGKVAEDFLRLLG